MKPCCTWHTLEDPGLETDDRNFILAIERPCSILQVAFQSCIGYDLYSVLVSDRLNDVPTVGATTAP